MINQVELVDSRGVTMPSSVALAELASTYGISFAKPSSDYMARNASDADLIAGLTAQLWIDLGNQVGTQIHPKWRMILEEEARINLAKIRALNPAGKLAEDIIKPDWIGAFDWKLRQEAEKAENCENLQVPPRRDAPMMMLEDEAPQETPYARAVRERDETIERRNDLMMQAVRDFS